MKYIITLDNLTYLGSEKVRFDRNGSTNEYKRVSLGDWDTWDKFVLSGDINLPEFENKTKVRAELQLSIREVAENGRTRTQTSLFVTNLVKSNG